MKKLPGSLEIKLHERLSKNDILNILAEHMTMLEETFGIEEFKLYSYLECYRDNTKQALYHNVHNIVVSSFSLRNQENLENTAKLISKRVITVLFLLIKNLMQIKYSLQLKIFSRIIRTYWSNSIQVITSL